MKNSRTISKIESYCNKCSQREGDKNLLKTNYSNIFTFKINNLSLQN